MLYFKSCDRISVHLSGLGRGMKACWEHFALDEPVAY